MNISNATAGNWLLLASCAAISAATYMAICQFVRAIFSESPLARDSWHREQARWKRLREVSATFRLLEGLIVGLALFIERRLPWFLCLPGTTNKFEQMCTTLFVVLFGRPKTVDEAVRIRNSEQPWSHAELVASGGVAAGAASAGMLVLTFDTLSLKWVALSCLCAGLLAYRVWTGSFASQAALRRRAIRRFLPHAMDTIAMVISSGDPFDVGLEMVIRDFPEHPLSQEFSRLRSNLNLGQTKQEALSETAYCICLPEFDELVGVLSRVQKHGAPAAENFTRLAKQLRMNQLRYMEEEVGRAEASMSLPTMLVMLACMLIAIGPFVLSFLSSNFLVQ